MDGGSVNNLENVAEIEFDGPAFFQKDDVKKLFQGKRVYFVGDSNMRAIYKDLVVLLREGKASHARHFKDKLEAKFKGDQVVDHADFTKGRDYIEVREYKEDGMDITYGFVTKCWPDAKTGGSKKHFLRDLLPQIDAGKVQPPDLIIMCSMLWDISRYGPHGVQGFKDSLGKVMNAVKNTKNLREGVFLWLTQPPVGKQATAPFLCKELDFMAEMMRFHVMEANAYSCDVMQKNQIDVFDLHYYMCYVTNLRDVDNTHWRPEGVRLMLCLVLTHVCSMWALQPPKFETKHVKEMSEITYTTLMRSLLYLETKKGSPEWLKKMIAEDPNLREYLDTFRPQQ